jgi:hypothetical protein
MQRSVALGLMSNSSGPVLFISLSVKSLSSIFRFLLVEESQNSNPVLGRPHPRS